MKFNKSDVSIHRSVDQSDPGFMLKGHKLRWVSAHVETRRAGRPWQPLKLSMLPENIVKHLEAHQRAWLGDGDTIRKKDLTLAFAPLAEVEALQANRREIQNANEAIFRGKARHRGGSVTSTGSSHKETVKDEASAKYS